jgi:hypothetical protein
MKYSQDQLRQRAVIALDAKASGDPRYAMLLMMLSLATGKTPDDCEAQIQQFANS